MNRIGRMAVAAGAVALGAMAFGAVAIGALAVGRARIRRLEIAEVEIGRLRVHGWALPPAEDLRRLASQGSDEADRSSGGPGFSAGPARPPLPATSAE